MVQETREAVSASFTGTGSTDAFVTRGGFNMSLSGFGDATAKLQRSFDQGVSWLDVESFTADVERRVDDPEQDVYYRVNISVYTSGTIVVRLSS